MSDALATDSLPSVSEDPGASAAWYKAVLKPKYLVPFAIFLIAAFALTSLKLVRVTQMSGDSAIFFQVTENIANRGVAVSQVFANTQAYLEGRLLTSTAEQIASDPLSPPSIAERNMLHFHGYFILYPVALFVKLFPSDAVLLALDVLSFTGIVLFAYLALRSKQIPIALAALFCVLIVSHPAWSQGLLLGQFYPDRLFILAGFAFMYFASRDATPRWALISLAGVCALINERGALIAGVFLLTYTLLFWRAERNRIFKLALSAALLLCGVLITKLLLTNAYYSTFMPTSVAQIAANFSNPDFDHKAALFALVNAPLLLLALFEWRAAVVAALLMLPNLLGYMGGAEKVGWITHYPSYYLPGLIWAAMAGFEKVYSQASTRRRTAGLYGGTAFLIFFLSSINPVPANTISINPVYATNNFLVQFPEQAAAYLNPGGLELRALPDQFRKAIPEGSVVSTPENLMPFLYRNRTIRYFPVDIDHADYAVLTVLGMQNGRPVYGGVTTYLGAAEAQKINALLIARMRKDGYALDHPQIFPSVSVAIVKRLH